MRHDNLNFREGRMTPRPYQSAALEALESYLRERDGNPCVVLPTGAGKTPTMAWAIQSYLSRWPDTRICVLAHIQELLEQGVEKMRAIWPTAPIGVYSAGLKSRDIGYAITYAGIQSVYDKACKFPPFDLIFIDEAHRIPLKSQGQYQQFIREARLNNPHVRVVGWTATDYRLDGGRICGPKYILRKVCYSANVKDLIDDGYLSSLRTKIGKKFVNASGVSKSGGDFNAEQLSKIANVSETVSGIAMEAVKFLDAENRRSCLFFAVTIEHAENLSAALSALDFDAPVIHSKTPMSVRTSLAEQFKAGQLRGLVNVNVLSEGFDAQRIDAVVMVRPTASKGLYYQQVGRGLRTHDSKADCLILDFAGNIARHGPIDQLEGCPPVMQTCGSCQEYWPRVLGKCPACAWEIPPGEATPAAEGSARQIPTDPSARTDAPILSDADPWTVPCTSVQVAVHKKADKPPTLMVTYGHGFDMHREWICLEHDGYAKAKAKQWWRSRFGDPVPETVSAALSGNLFLADAIKAKTESITVKRDGKYTQIIRYNFRKEKA